MGSFKNKKKQLFELLITISGIGPKVAIAILNATTVATLVTAVTTKDSSVLIKISGIGKKNAEKIILELENKIDQSWIAEGSNTGSQDIEVFEALEALGYRPRDIQEVLQDPSLAELDSAHTIRQALKLLAR